VRQAVNFRDHQGIAFARKLDCRFELLAQRDRAYVLAEQFLSSPATCSMVEVLP
jgi:hypothetical protein